MDASNIIKPALSRGEMQAIGATTLNEYRKHIEKDAAFERRFQQVQVGEPSVEDTVLILQGIAPQYEKHHHVHYTPKALECAASLAKRYLTGRFLPDKAIDLMDEAGSRLRVSLMTRPADIKTEEETLRRLEHQKAQAVDTQDFEAAARLRDEIKSLQQKIDNSVNGWKKEMNSTFIEVTEDDVLEYYGGWENFRIAVREEMVLENVFDFLAEANTLVPPAAAE
jgi:ATP-dependent Clp protease ATP-binding subunit ClpC